LKGINLDRGDNLKKIRIGLDCYNWNKHITEDVVEGQNKKKRGELGLKERYGKESRNYKGNKGFCPLQDQGAG
jgi:hypothetical protein